MRLVQDGAVQGYNFIFNKEHWFYINLVRISQSMAIKG